MKSNAFSFTPWIQYRKWKPGARLRFFCFPHAGSGASVFRSFSEHLPDEIELWPVQLPGRENRFLEKPFVHLDTLIDALQTALIPYLDMPYVFLGHSMGALVSFELTRALHRNGHPLLPLHLFVSAHRAPHFLPPESSTFQLPGPLFLEKVRSYNGIPEALLDHTELLQMMLPLLRADFQLCETYIYTEAPPLTCPITALGGDLDHAIPSSSIYAWQKQTRSSFQAFFFPGDHFFLFHHQKDAVNIIQRALL